MIADRKRLCIKGIMLEATYKPMIKVRVREGLISCEQVLADIADNYGDLIDLDITVPTFTYEVYGLTLKDMQSSNLRYLLLDRVLEHADQIGKYHYEFVGFDNYAKTNAVKVVLDDMTNYLENLM